MQFNRRASLVIGPKAGGRGVDVSGLRVSFVVEKDVTPALNQASVLISNLSPATRNQIQENYSKLILSVGYENEDLIVLYQGDISKIDHQVIPPEIETTLVCGDGRAAVRDTRISLSLEPGCSVGEACKVIADRMGLGLDDFSASNNTLPSGISFVGPADKALREIAATAALEYSIQGGRIQLLKRDALRPGTGFLIAPSTGLVGSPERVVEADGKLEKNVPRVQWAFRCLLNPRLQPADRIRIESAEVNGTFRLIKVRHVGDTHGDPWFSECQVATS